MESIKEQYWRYSLIAIIIGVSVILFFEATPFLGGIRGAFTIYILLRKQMFYLTEQMRIRPSIAASLLLGETILFFLIPISLAVWLIIDKIQDINLDPTLLLNAGQEFADFIQKQTGFDVWEKSNILKALSVLPQIGQFLVSGISSFAINVVVLIFILYFMLIGGRAMERYMYTLVPFDDRNKDEVLGEINMIVKSNAIGIPLLALIQGIVALIGYLIFGAPDPLLFGFLTCLATIIPIVGTALVWVPLAAYMALAGDWIHALGLFVYSLLILTNVDNLIRFVLQKKLADTHPLITVFGVVIGLSVFGFMGIIFGPLLLSLLLLCVDIFKKTYLDNK